MGLLVPEAKQVDSDDACCCRALFRAGTFYHEDRRIPPAARLLAHARDSRSCLPRAPKMHAKMCTYIVQNCKAPSRRGRIRTKGKQRTSGNRTRVVPSPRQQGRPSIQRNLKKKMPHNTEYERSVLDRCQPTARACFLDSTTRPPFSPAEVLEGVMFYWKRKLKLR